MWRRPSVEPYAHPVSWAGGALRGSTLDARVAKALVAILSQEDPTAVPRSVRADPALVAEPAFLLAAEHHRVAPAVFVSLQHYPAVPDPVLARLARGHHEQVFRHAAALGNVQALGRILDRIGCDWAVIKGPYLASYVHPRPDLRTYLDLDVVVDHRRLPEVIDALVASGNTFLDRNWTLIRESDRAQVSLLLPMGTPLDLHWHLLNRGRVRNAFFLDMDEVLGRARTRELGPVAARVLDDADALVHIALHASLAGASRLVWIHDVHALVTRCPLDMDVVVQRAVSAGAGLTLAVVLQRAQATFGTQVSDDVLNRLASPYGWRAATRLLDSVRPVESGYGRRYMGRTLVRATRADSRASWREFRYTAVRNARRRFQAHELESETIAVNPLHDLGGDQRDRDEFFAFVASGGQT